MEDFVTYELAVKLKEKGYPQHICDYAYITEDDYEENKYVVGDREYIPFIPDYLPTIAAPIISQVLKWLESTKKIFLTVDIEPMGFFFIINYDILTNENGEYEFEIYNSTNTYPSSKEAALEGIEYVLNNLI